MYIDGRPVKVNLSLFLNFTRLMPATLFSKLVKKQGKLFLVFIYLELRFLDSAIMKDYQLPATVECVS